MKSTDEKVCLLISLFLSGKELTTKQIIDIFDSHGLSAERKAIYRYLNTITFYFPLIAERRGLTTVYKFERID